MSIDQEQQIRERAYQIWEREGRVHGRHEEHWYSAKLELTSTAPDLRPAAIDSSALAAAAAPQKPRARAKGAATIPEPKAPAKAPAKAGTKTPAKAGPKAAAPRRRSPAQPTQ